MAERLDDMSSVKSGEFRSQLEVYCVSRYPEELKYNEAVCQWMPIYIYIYIYIYTDIDTLVPIRVCITAAI